MKWVQLCSGLNNLWNCLFFFFFGFEWKLTFSSPVAIFQIWWHIVCSNLPASSFRIWNNSVGIPSPLLSLFIIMCLRPNFIELDKLCSMRSDWLAVWLWFQSACPLMPSLSTYHLTWASLTLDVGYLFTAAPAKHSHCSLPWTWCTSSQLPPMSLGVG